MWLLRDEREIIERLERFKTLPSGAGEREWDRVVEAYRPLVVSVCRRYLRDPNDVQDAVQQTFLKFAEHAGKVESSLVAWLASAAQSSSVDLIRSCVRERRRREGLARSA